MTFFGDDHESLLHDALRALEDDQVDRWWREEFAGSMPALREWGERSGLGFELALKSAAVLWAAAGAEFGAIWLAFAKAVGVSRVCRELLDYGLGRDDPDFVEAFEALIAKMDSPGEYDEGQST